METPVSLKAQKFDSTNAYMETLVDYLKVTKPKGFKPRPFYSVEGDSLTFFFKDEPSYRERIDDFLTVYKSMTTEKLVGCQIKGLPKAMKLLGDFGLIIEDQPVRLGMIFMAASMAATPEPNSQQHYVELGRIACKATIPVKELEPISA